MFSAINLLGLTAGITSVLLIYLYVQHEYSYDRFHEKADRMYRINQTFIWGEDDENQFASLGPGVAYAIASDVPEAEAVTRIHPPGSFLVTYQNGDDIKSYDEDGILAVDTNFFQVFTFPLVKGNPQTALSKPNAVVLSETAAEKYFGNADPMGKLITLGEGDNAVSYAVTGVAKDAPDNSYIEFDMLVSMSSFRRVQYANDVWMWTMFETFVLLKDGASPETLRAKLEPLPRKYASPTLEQAMNQTFDQYIASGKEWDLFVQPFTSIRLHSSNVYNRINEVGSITIVKVLVGVMIFIVILSCINFMNLSTAQYTRRIKESGLRKVLGSDRFTLAMHFFSEALMFCILAAVLGICLTQTLLPFFNTLTASELSLNILDVKILAVLGGLIVLMSIFSGSYPAIFLSRFSPAEAVKGKFRAGRSGKLLRNGLVTVQFGISMVLLVSTLVVFQQLKFLFNKDIGFNRNNLLVINKAERVNDQKTFLHALTNYAGVTQGSISASVPPKLYDGDQFMAQGTGKVTPLNFTKADRNFIPTLELKIIAGRNFSESDEADKKGIILNENAANAFGWNAEEALGKIIEYNNGESFEVIGVVRDFNYWELQAAIQPMAIFHMDAKMYSTDSRVVALRLDGQSNASITSIIQHAEAQWKNLVGDRPFEYEFVEDAFQKSFDAEKRFGYAMVVFAALAILIASFGLLGMIVHTLEQRTKEIGIRKVVGASVSSIWSLVIRDYTKLIFAAIVLSVPVSVYLLQGWLNDFNYRIELGVSPFAWAGGSILFTALVVTSYHVIKAALTNPVDVLKDE